MLPWRNTALLLVPTEISRRYCKHEATRLLLHGSVSCAPAIPALGPAAMENDRCGVHGAAPVRNRYAGQTRALRTLVRWSFGQKWLVPVIQHAFFALARFPSVTKNMIDAFRPYQAHLQLACDESGNTVFHFFSTAAGPRTHYYVRHLLHTWKCANARAPNRAGVTAGELFAQTGQLRCARLCGYSPRNDTRAASSSF